MADASRSLPLAATVLLVTALLAGGTARPMNDLLVLLASLPLLYVLLAQQNAPKMVWTGKLALALAALALVQLIPLPPAIWTSLPGRDLAAASLIASGNEIGWRPIALNPAAAVGAMLFLVAPITAHIAASRLQPADMRRLFAVVAGFGLMSAVLGIVQRLSGGLSLYDTEHIGAALGLFANRNHHADLLIAAMLLAPALVPHARLRQHRITLTALLALLVFAVIATTSRAGIALTIPAALVSLAVIWRPQPRQAAILIGTAAIAGVAIMYIPAFGEIFARFGVAGEDQRLTMARDTLAATRAMWPVGSGYGSFVPVYMAYEDLDMMQARYVVAAHNDYLQLALEGGIAGIITALAGPVAILFLGWSLIRRKAPALIWAAWVLAVIILLHSAVDFPLRTATLAVIFGLCTGAAQGGTMRLRDGVRNGI
ncbi:O-antigen ligase family protein [Pontixanthobacter luteolus]|uniref:O-antigen ligase family protein n=1 Tax=Pontixanthobacter luteolus TaxID=295089 RepID=UPI002302DA66|nr:O-antigen ligase family protein [Pontixanthobacter luteolus]